MKPPHEEQKGHLAEVKPAHEAPPSHLAQVALPVDDAFSELDDFLEADENGVLMPRRYLFDEERYLEGSPDVADAVKRGAFGSGHAHWRAHGKFEGRAFVDSVWACPSSYLSSNFDEARYRAENPDVAGALAHQRVNGAKEHWHSYGRAEARRFPSRAIVGTVTDWARHNGLYVSLPPKAPPAKED